MSGAGCLLPTLAARAAAAADQRAIALVRGDEAAVRRLLAAHEIDAAVPRAGWQGWVQDVAVALVNWVGELIGRSIRALGVTVPGLQWAAVAVVASALLLVATVAIRAWLRRRRSPAGGGPSGAPMVRPPVADAGAWRRRLDEALAAGDVAGALEAAWWWLARSLGAAAVDPAWTSGELVRRCRREDLRPTVGVLDALAFGARPPSVADVRALVARLEGALR